MKLYLTWLILSLITFTIAVDRPTASVPVASGGIVCAMSLCPTAALLGKRDLTCPSYCKNNCRIIDDQCCPGVQKTVCNDNASSTTESSAVTTTSSNSNIATLPITKTLTSSASSQPSQSIAGNTPSSAQTTEIMWNSIVFISIFTVFMNLNPFI